MKGATIREKNSPANNAIENGFTSRTSVARRYSEGMASREQAVPENVPGAFFVDTTCIDCDTCRQLAPATFGETGDFSYVQLQPRDRASAAPPFGRWSPVRPGRSAADTARNPRSDQRLSAAAGSRRLLLRLQFAQIVRRQQLLRRASRTATGWSIRRVLWSTWPAVSPNAAASVTSS